MATCFDSIEPSLGLPKNRSNVSKFIVHYGIPECTIVHYGISECTINVDTLDLFFGKPDYDSIESKRVAIRIFFVIDCCV
jgi:hypothetical protein